jgi:hypothetical protein
MPSTTKRSKKTSSTKTKGVKRWYDQLKTNRSNRLNGKILIIIPKPDYDPDAASPSLYIASVETSYVIKYLRGTIRYEETDLHEHNDAEWPDKIIKYTDKGNVLKLLPNDSIMYGETLTQLLSNPHKDTGDATSVWSYFAKLRHEKEAEEGFFSNPGTAKKDRKTVQIKAAELDFSAKLNEALTLPDLAAARRNSAQRDCMDAINTIFGFNNVAIQKFSAFKMKSAKSISKNRVRKAYDKDLERITNDFPTEPERQKTNVPKIFLEKLQKLVTSVNQQKKHGDNCPTIPTLMLLEDVSNVDKGSRVVYLSNSNISKKDLNEHTKEWSGSERPNDDSRPHFFNFKSILDKIDNKSGMDIRKTFADEMAELIAVKQVGGNVEHDKKWLESISPETPENMVAGFLSHARLGNIKLHPDFNADNAPKSKKETKKKAGSIYYPTGFLPPDANKGRAIYFTSALVLMAFAKRYGMTRSYDALEQYLPMAVKAAKDSDNTGIAKRISRHVEGKIKELLALSKPAPKKVAKDGGKAPTRARGSASGDKVNPKGGRKSLPRSSQQRQDDSDDDDEDTVKDSDEETDTDGDTDSDTDSEEDAMPRKKQRRSS